MRISKPDTTGTKMTVAERARDLSPDDLRERIERVKQEFYKAHPDLMSVIPSKDWPPSLEERVAQLEEYTNSNYTIQQGWVDELKDNFRIILNNQIHLKQQIEKTTASISDLLTYWPRSRRKLAPKKPKGASAEATQPASPEGPSVK